MSDIEARYQQLVAALKDCDYRLTPQRAALLRLLAASDGHPSATDLFEQIHAQFPSTSPATVYKTLHLLKSVGQVLELGFSNDDNRYDGHHPQPHPHLICTRCRQISDLPADLASFVTAEVISQLTTQTGYRLMEHRLEFYGICPSCQHAAQTLIGDLSDG